MKSIGRLLASLMLSGLCSVSVFADATKVTWSDLAPPVAEIANPFERLSQDQMDALRKILRLESIGTKEKKAEADALRSELAGQDLDVDKLFAARLEIMTQRRAAASAVNQAVVGKEIRIPGYVLPLEMRDRKAVEFLLVPTVGACIHTPPPPANQLIHVTHPDGIAVTGLYDAVWVTGLMEEAKTVQNVRYSDGASRVEVSYRIRSAQVERYSKP